MCTCMVLHFKHDVGLYEAREGIGLVPISRKFRCKTKKETSQMLPDLWENMGKAHVGEGVSEGHKNCWNQKG